MQDKLKVDLKRLANSQLVSGISKQLNVYEKKVKELVSSFDLKSREAREKSLVQLDKFAHQLKKTRVDVEKRVRDILDQEGQRLNKGFGDLVNYLKSMANNEKLAKTNASVKKRVSKAKSGESSTAKKSSKTRRSTGSSTHRHSGSHAGAPSSL